MIFDAVKRAVFLSICEGVKKLLCTLKSEQPAQRISHPREILLALNVHPARPVRGNVPVIRKPVQERIWGREQENLK